MQVSPRIAMAVAALGGAATLLSILSSQWFLAIIAAATASVGLLLWWRPSATGDGTLSAVRDPVRAPQKRTPDR